MSTKGPSNLYGNAKHGKKGQITSHTGYAWARNFNKHTLEDHALRHGQLHGTEGYLARAITFANRIDRENHISYIRKDGTTVKYSRKTNEFVVVDRRGIIHTYYHPKAGIKAYYQDRRAHQ